ncbi:hypothetical protein FJT64_025129 [Amphibalanus amphitrite]|uniref:C2H2-type domain-containing protein n=1 Tax=Amphibalanus amphitrite TaxID=1232801 RepID=A0A6A4WKS1_AMPAM|nr:hypothetical protein FJT64_025129 [Amphibalanus amphitrite]
MRQSLRRHIKRCHVALTDAQWVCGGCGCPLPYHFSRHGCFAQPGAARPVAMPHRCWCGRSFTTRRGLTNHARLCRRSPVHVDTPSLSLSRETADADRPAPGDDAVSLPPLTPPEAPVRGSASDPGPGSPRSSLSSPLADRRGSGGRPAADDVTDNDVTG